MVTTDKMLNIHESICHVARNLARNRGQEYSGDADTLATFKQVGADAVLKPSRVAAVMLSIKVSRLQQQLLLGERPYDTLHDMINYAVYTEILFAEENGDKTQDSS